MDLDEKYDKELELLRDKAFDSFTDLTNEKRGIHLSAKIQYYLNELLRRNIVRIDNTFKSNIEETQKLIEEQERTRKQAKIWSWTNGILSFLMIILAGVTIWYASIDSKTDDMLIEKQEKLLKEINSSINESNILLLQIKDTNKKKVQDISPEP